MQAWREAGVRKGGLGLCSSEEVTSGQTDREILRELRKMVSNWCSAWPFPSKQESALKALGTEGLFLFSSLDTDRDMYISPEEFRPISEKLTGTRRGWGLGGGSPGTTLSFLAAVSAPSRGGTCSRRKIVGPGSSGVLLALAPLAAGLDELFQHMHTHTNTHTHASSLHM